MALSFKNQELERLVRRRAKRRGETLTQAILSALREGERSAAGEKRVTAEALLSLAAKFRELPVLSTQSEDEILGYDEHDIPG